MPSYGSLAEPPRAVLGATRGSNALASVVALLGCVALVAIAWHSSALPQVLEGSPFQSLDATDFDVSKWSQRHMNTVASNGVDARTAKGIWHSKDEAWAGIDEVLPTDTPYAYQMQHSGDGEEAKMEAFLEHAKVQLRSLEKSLPKTAEGKDAAKLSTLKKVLAAGDTAMKNIEAQTAYQFSSRTEEAARPQQLRVLPAESIVQAAPVRRTQLATTTHYETAESAADDLDSYFDNLGSQTEATNARNARKAGYSYRRRGASSSQHTQTLQQPVVQQVLARPSPSKEDMKDFAHEFAVQLATALKDSSKLSQRLQTQPPEGASEGCVLCMKIAGCMDCCSPVCGEGNLENAEDDNAWLKHKAPVATPVLSDRLNELEKKVAELEQQKGRGRSARRLCVCQTAECKECPDTSEEEVRASKVLHLVEEKEALHKAEKAVATTNAILRERVAAADALNKMAIKQGLGAYEPEADDAAWVAREPFPGKSETVASGMTDSVAQLSRQLMGAKRQIAAYKQELRTAEKAAIHGAVVTAKEKSIINALKATGANKVHFNKQRTNLLQPFYRQPGYGGRAVDRTIKRFKALEAKGEAPEY